MEFLSLRDGMDVGIEERNLRWRNFKRNDGVEDK